MENHIIQLLRRIHNIDSLIEYSIKSIYTPPKVCILYDNGKILLDVIIEYIVERMYHDYFGDIDDNSKEWEEMYNIIVKYVTTTHGEKIIEYYNNNCKK